MQYSTVQYGTKLPGREMSRISPRGGCRKSQTFGRGPFLFRGRSSSREPESGMYYCRSQDGSIRWGIGSQEGWLKEGPRPTVSRTLRTFGFHVPRRGVPMLKLVVQVSCNSPTPLWPKYGRLREAGKHRIAVRRLTGRRAPDRCLIGRVYFQYCTSGGNQGEASRVDTALQSHPTILPQTVEHIEHRIG